LRFKQYFSESSFFILGTGWRSCRQSSGVLQNNVQGGMVASMAVAG